MKCEFVRRWQNLVNAHSAIHEHYNDKKGDAGIVFNPSWFAEQIILVSEEFDLTQEEVIELKKRISEDFNLRMIWIYE